MARVHLERLSFGYGGPIDILREATLELGDGFTGVVGANGSGKSTLLSLIAGELSPTGGRVRVSPASARVVRCPQDVERLAEGVCDFGWAWDKAAMRLRARLGRDPEELDRWPTLSPGERRCWQIAAALWSRPDVLLLDEPTNHVDADTRSRLVDALRRAGCAGVVVSHDRALLDRLTSRTALLHAGELRLYPGSYRRARSLWIGERARAEEELARADRAVRAEKRRLAHARQSHAAAARSVRTSARSKSRRDADARSMARKFSAQKASSKLGRAVQTRGRELERAAAERERRRLDKQRGSGIAVAYDAAPTRWVCRLELGELRAGPRVLARDLALFVERQTRVRVAGDNGSGKSTLLGHLVDAARDPARVLLLPQELGERERAGLLRDVLSQPPRARGALLQHGAALGLEPARVLASESLSPGEARKLIIARGLARGVEAMLLDEPTNHLDLPSIERLQEALAAFPGALVLISHDGDFARALTDTTWRLGGGALERTAPGEGRVEP